MRRLLGQGLLVLLLGLATTLGLAWATAAWIPLTQNHPRVSGSFERWGRAWFYVEVRRPWGGVARGWGDLAEDDWTDTPAGVLKALAPPRPAGELVAEDRRLQQTRRTRFPFVSDNEPPSWGTFAGAGAP